MVDTALFARARKKRLKIYLEYPTALPGLEVPAEPLHLQLERGVVTSPDFGAQLKEMSILGINDCYILPVKADSPLLVLAKVAGFDKAEYGIADVPHYPLLFEKDNLLIGTTKLTNFATGRYGPNDAWKQLWTWILSRMTGKSDVVLHNWPAYVTPMYGPGVPLPPQAKTNSIRKGVEWFRNGRFFIHPSWEQMLPGSW